MVRPSVAPAIHLRVRGSMLSRRKRTDPSPNRQFTPPEWKLNGSSFGPQLFCDQRHSGGPPVGVLKLLILAVREASELLGPDRPFVPESGSAHAYMRRPPLLPPVQAGPSPFGEGRVESEPNAPALGCDR